MKAKHLLIVAGISLASAFTFSCSSDDSGGSPAGGNAGATIFCKTDEACVEISAETCLAFNGKPVNSCDATPPSSSSVGGSSSSVGGQNSSSSSTGTSSSSGAISNESIDGQWAKDGSNGFIIIEFESVSRLSAYNYTSWLFDDSEPSRYRGTYVYTAKTGAFTIINKIGEGSATVGATGNIVLNDNGKITISDFPDQNFNGTYTSAKDLVVTIPPANCSGYNSGALSNKGIFTDSRDGKIYNTIKICDQTWMAENLNFDAPGSVCYDDDTDNCETYGRLYDWATAMDIDMSFNNRDYYGTNFYCMAEGSRPYCFYDPAVTPHRGICPSGWHLPNYAEIYALFLSNILEPRQTFGAKLKATSGWLDSEGVSGNGTDDYGFAALPGGSLYNSSSGEFTFRDIGERGYWWSTTEADGLESIYLNIRHSQSITISEYRKIRKISIRCVKDN